MTYLTFGDCRHSDAKKPQTRIKYNCVTGNTFGRGPRLQTKRVIQYPFISIFDDIEICKIQLNYFVLLFVKSSILLHYNSKQDLILH